MAKSEKSSSDHATFAAEADELSLADARTTETNEAVPDNLDVRSDAVMVMHGTLQRLRKPALAVALGVGFTIAAIAVVGILGRTRTSDIDPARGLVR